MVDQHLMALFEVIIPSTLTTNITSNNQKTNVLILAVSLCCPGMDWGLVQCFMQNQPRQAQPPVTILWLLQDVDKRSVSQRSERALRALSVPRTLFCSWYSADTQLCSSNTQSANQTLLFEICQALDYFPFKLSLSTWFHIFVPPCSIRMSSHHT